MAEIPVERKSGFPWWLLLIGALLLAVLLWFLLADNDDDSVADLNTDDRVEEEMVGYAVGESIDFDSIRVTELTGDMSFRIEAPNGHNHFVVFDQTPTPGTAKEGLFDINPGDRLNIMGTMRDRSYRLPTTVTATIPSSDPKFIYATNIEKL